MNHNVVEEGKILAFADSAIFSKEAVLKCLYWYGDKFHVSVNATSENLYAISLTPFDHNMKEDQLAQHLFKLENDLLDFQLRETISIETKNIRELLVAKAFSNGEFDEEPIGNTSDPVGFDPSDIDSKT